MWLEDTFTLSVGSVTVCARPTSGGHKPNMFVCVLRLSSANKQKKKLYFIGNVRAAQKVGASKESVDKVIFFSVKCQANIHQSEVRISGQHDRQRG